MTDPKPTQPSEAYKRAASAVASMPMHHGPNAMIEYLEAQFSAGAAIARRRAIEEAAAVCELWASHNLAAFTDQAIAASCCAQNIRALLRAPTSEKAEELPEGEATAYIELSEVKRLEAKAYARGLRDGACSPPADGGGV